MSDESLFPPAKHPGEVGSYPARVCAGGGFVWDAVLEYRVWCHPKRGAPDATDAEDCFHAFASYEDAVGFSRDTDGAEDPLALILQEEYLSEPQPGVFVHEIGPRLTEWPVEFLARPKRTDQTIPGFLASDAPANRLDILRGLAG